MSRSNRSISWRAISAARSIKYSLILWLLIAVGLSPCAFAYEPSDTVGQPQMLLAGMSGHGSRTEESVLGDACADAVRTSANAQFAIVHGGAFCANLEPKVCTYADIRAVLTDPDEPIAVAELTAAQLTALLEAGVAKIELNEREAIDRERSAFDGFPQVSGLTVTYDASARAGERLLRLRADGQPLDLTDETVTYRVAAPMSLFSGAYGYPVYPCETVGCTLSEALAALVAAGTGESYTGEGRILAVGCTDYNIVNHFPVVLCVVAAMVIWLGARL